MDKVLPLKRTASSAWAAPPTYPITPVQTTQPRPLRGKVVRYVDAGAVADQKRDVLVFQAMTTPAFATKNESSVQTVVAC